MQPLRVTYLRWQQHVLGGIPTVVEPANAGDDHIVLHGYYVVPLVDDDLRRLGHKSLVDMSRHQAVQTFDDVAKAFVPVHGSARIDPAARTMQDGEGVGRYALAFRVPLPKPETHVRYVLPVEMLNVQLGADVVGQILVIVFQCSALMVACDHAKYPVFDRVQVLYHPALGFSGTQDFIEGVNELRCPHPVVEQIPGKDQVGIGLLDRLYKGLPLGFRVFHRPEMYVGDREDVDVSGERM